MKILIVTYTYPPSKAVNGFRPYHFANSLAKKGHTVHVLSRQFNNAEASRDDSNPDHTPFSMIREEEVIVYRTPFINSWYRYKKSDWLVKSGAWKIIYLIQLMLGRTTQESYNEYFKPYLNQLLSEHVYDFILVESGPTNLVRIVSQLALKYRIRYAIDFRDVYYHDMCRIDQGKVSWMNRLKIYLEKHYMRESIEHSLFCISLSDTLHDILEVPQDKRELVINGFDEMAWHSIQPQPGNDYFRIVIGGKLYDREFLHPFLQSIRLFLNKQLPSVEVLFIAPGNAGVINRIKAELNDQNVKIINDRLNLQETLKELSSAQVLMYHGWSGYRGMTSTKIYDYIRSGKHILIIPGDHDVIDTLLNQFPIGMSIDDPAIGANQLEVWYHQWVSSSAEPKLKDEVALFSRTHQNEVLNRIISRRLNKNAHEVVA